MSSAEYSDQPENARDRRRAASAARRNAKTTDLLARLEKGLEDSRLCERSYGRGSGASRSQYPQTR